MSTLCKNNPAFANLFHTNQKMSAEFRRRETNNIERNHIIWIIPLKLISCPVMTFRLYKLSYNAYISLSYINSKDLLTTSNISLLRNFLA